MATLAWPEFLIIGAVQLEKLRHGWRIFFEISQPKVGAVIQDPQVMEGVRVGDDGKGSGVCVLSIEVVQLQPIDFNAFERPYLYYQSATSLPYECTTYVTPTYSLILPISGIFASRFAWSLNRLMPHVGHNLCALFFGPNSYTFRSRESQ